MPYVQIAPEIVILFSQFRTVYQELTHGAYKLTGLLMSLTPLLTSYY
jgi:hypothetical protein